MAWKDRFYNMDQKVRELRRNTIIIGVANVCSKAIVFILAPLYSYFLSTEQYGIMEIITSTVTLLIPFVCFDIYEATFRFSNPTEYDDDKTVFSSSIFVCIIGSLLFAVIAVVLKVGFSVEKYYVYTIAFAVAEAFNHIMQQYARGQNRMHIFAFSSVLNTICLLVCNLYFLCYLRMGLTGWLLSYLFAKLVVAVYLCVGLKVGRTFSIRSISFSYIKKYLRFCLPLMPTNTMWWIMNVSDRYMITYFIGASATGLYGVSAKFPSVVSILENVFYQSWQTTAIHAMGDKDRDKFFSDIITKYIVILCIGIMGLLSVSRQAIAIFFSNDYYEAWYCAAPLIVAVLMHAVSGCLGSMYTVFKKTNGVLYSAVFGGIVNIILNALLIPRMGSIGAAIATLVGYTVVMIIRWKDSTQFCKLTLNFKEIVVFYILIPVQLVLYYVATTWSFVAMLVLDLLIIIRYRNLLLGVIRK